ncbi:hypothetical protein [Oryzicola mucosus]|nr:hypothetical protein [Oryzicola mucosus]
MKDRFELVLEPTDLWTVWDTQTEEPAVFGDRSLIALLESEAIAACEILNGVHQKRQAAQAGDAKEKKTGGGSAA